MLKLEGISKSFPGVQALNDVGLEVRPGEIHGLVGENGAGKSTLIKIVAGAYAPDRGEIFFDGTPVRWSSPREAKQRGVHVVYQEFVLFPQLSVAENIFIGHERRTRFGIVDHARTRRDANEILKRLGISLDPRAIVGSLSVADQQMIEIARAMVHKVKLLVLDEPTAVIAGREVILLFDRLRRLRASGVSVIFISHRLEEVFTICDRVTVLKDGQLVGTRDVADVTRERLISMMVGRDLGDLYPPKRAAAPLQRSVLRTEALSIAGRVHDVSLELRPGEIVALAGMVGAGRIDLANRGIEEVTDHYRQLISGMDRLPILVGHSFGGMVAEKLLREEQAVAAIGIDAAQSKGVLPQPLSTLYSKLPVFKDPAARHAAIALSSEQFRSGFGTAIDAQESDELWERWGIPAPGRPLFEAAATTASGESPAELASESTTREPLLLVLSGPDDSVAHAIVKAAAKRSKHSRAETDVLEYVDRGHSLTIDHGWEDVAGDCLTWLDQQGR